VICLRCGYCCVMYNVTILENPMLGINKDNLIHKGYLERCQHLEGAEPGEFSCAIHNYAIYRDTPCYQHSQIEKDETDECRMGRYQIDKFSQDINWLDEAEELRKFH